MNNTSLPEGKMDKRYHPWGQSVIEAKYFIEHLSTSNATVYDPMVGGGTVCVAAKQLQRQWIGNDIEKSCVDTSRKRLVAVDNNNERKKILKKKHSIICGDSREVYPKLIEDGTRIDLILCDPPYNIGFDGYDEHHDSYSEQDYISLLKTFRGDVPLAIIQYPEETMKYVVPALGAPDKVLTWCYNSNLPRQHRLISIYNAKPDFSRVKQPFRNPDDNRIASLIEMGVRGAKSYDWIELDIVKNVSKADNPHPCPVPQALFEWLILLLSKPDGGTMVYDPFMGSGSSMLAAHALGRNFVGTEINADYIKTAKRRLAKARKEAKEGSIKTPGTVTAHVGNNAVLFREVAQMYLQKEMRVADVTYGKGVFWREVDTTQFDFHPSDIHTSHEHPYDFRHLPYEDDEFDALILDPPNAHTPESNAATTKRMYHKEIMELYHEGIIEAKRVLKKGGLLMVKCQDEVESSSQRRSHMEIHAMAMQLGMKDEDLFLLVQPHKPTIQHKDKKHARKNNSFLWVFRKK